MDDTKKVLGNLGKGLGKAIGSEVKNIARSSFEQIGASSSTEERSEKKDNVKKPVDENERKRLIEGLYGSNNFEESKKAVSQKEQGDIQKLENLRSRLHQEVQRLGETVKQEPTVRDRLERKDQEEGQKKQIEAIEERKKAPITPSRKGPERKLGIGG